MPSNGEYDILVSADVASALPIGLRQGHRCCGGCCDMRRAVVIVNIIHCLIMLFSIMIMAMTAKMIEEGEISMTDGMDIDDDEILEEGGAFFRRMEHMEEWVLFVYIVFGAAGAYGAVKFTIVPVGVSLGLYVLEFFYGLFAYDISVVLLAGFFAYPHVFFIKQVKEGIMSEDKYELEKHSCCCV